MLRVAVLLAIAGCIEQHFGPVPGETCISGCGLALYESEDCAGLLAAEAAFLSAMERYRPDPLAIEGYGPGAYDACQRIEYSGVTIRPAGVGADGPGGYVGHGGAMVAGETWCDFRTIVLGSDDWTANAFGHELLHIIENCRGPYDHSGWTWEHWAVEAESYVDWGPGGVVAPD